MRAPWGYYATVARLFGVSKQRAQQLGRRAQGRCEICGRAPTPERPIFPMPTSTYCTVCYTAQKARMARLYRERQAGVPVKPYRPRSVPNRPRQPKAERRTGDGGRP